MATRPTFSHPKQEIDCFVNMILDDHTLDHRVQYIITAGILLNNIELVKYAASIDPASVNTVITRTVFAAVENIILGTNNTLTMLDGKNSPN